MNIEICLLKLSVTDQRLDKPITAIMNHPGMLKQQLQSLKVRPSPGVRPGVNLYTRCDVNRLMEQND
jgi:hypothetical protein